MTDTELLNLLNNDIELLNNAAETLSKSYQNCLKIGLKEDYSFEELTEFEALSRRFARSTDILIQKIFKLIDQLNLAPEGTIRDSINRAEKNLLIDSFESLVEMRRIRNQVSYEYVTDQLSRLYERIVSLSPVLLDCVERTKTYCKKNFQ